MRPLLRAYTQLPHTLTAHTHARTALTHALAALIQHMHGLLPLDGRHEVLQQVLLDEVGLAVRLAVHVTMHRDGGGRHLYVLQHLGEGEDGD